VLKFLRADHVEQLEFFGGVGVLVEQAVLSHHFEGIGHDGDRDVFEMASEIDQAGADVAAGPVWRAGPGRRGGTGGRVRFGRRATRAIAAAMADLDDPLG
jgi:hypothetical protein